MKKAIKIVLIIIVVLALLVGAGFGGAYAIAQTKVKQNAPRYPLSNQVSKGDDKIHFLSTGSSDCIIIESNGHFGMIDAGEDNDNPRNLPNLELKGYEDVVLKYLKENCADENGKVTLDFVLGTHSHSDHIGGFDTVINDKDVTVKYGYLKKYHSENMRDKETEEWDNQEVYDQMMTAMEKNGVEIIQDLENVEFNLGDFKIEIFNGAEDTVTENIGENDNSLVCRVTKGNKVALLTGDFDNISGDESKYAKEIGKVDLLKPGHHGYSHSSSRDFIKTINPDLVVCTNDLKKMNLDVKLNLTVFADASLYGTNNENGIIVEFTDDNQLKLFTNIM